MDSVPRISSGEKYTEALNPSFNMNTAELSAKIKGTVLTPGAEGYERSLARWAVNTERKAAVVVLVKSAEDVVAAVSLPIL